LEITESLRFFKGFKLRKKRDTPKEAVPEKGCDSMVLGTGWNKKKKVRNTGLRTLRSL